MVAIKNKKRTVLEIFLVVIILFQAGVIYYFYKTATALMHRDVLLGERRCFEVLEPIFKLEEKEEFDAIILIAEYLNQNRFEDKLLFLALSKAYYFTGNLAKAAEFLEKAISAEFHCQIYKPQYAT